MWRDRWGAIAQVLIAGSGAIAVLISFGERWREEHIAEYYALLTAAGAGMLFFVQASNLMTLFLGLEWFSVALYVLTAIDIDLIGSLEAGLKYLVIGAVGSATLLFGSALVYGATGQLSFDAIAAAGHQHDVMLVTGLAHDHRRARVQVVVGAVPHVDARRLPGLADAGHRVHGVGDEDRGVRRHLPHRHDRVSAATSTSGDGRSR